MIPANEGPRVSEIIELLDWQDRPDDYIMVLERPSPCDPDPDVPFMPQEKTGVQVQLSSRVFVFGHSSPKAACLRLPRSQSTSHGHHRG